MKDNVDLTLDRKFSRNRNTTRIVPNRKYPWDFSDINTEWIYYNTSSIALGNKDQRSKQKYYRDINSGKCCDCCGCTLNKIPWRNERGICIKCDSKILRKSKIEERCPWRDDTLSRLFDAVSNIRMFT